MVGEAGLEPTISCSQSTCVTNYATPRRPAGRDHDTAAEPRRPCAESPWTTGLVRPVVAEPVLDFGHGTRGVSLFRRLTGRPPRGVAEPADAPTRTRARRPPVHTRIVAQRDGVAYDRRDCPTCRTILTRLPKARSACPACGTPISVRTCPEGVRHLLRADQVDVASFSWRSIHAGRVKEEVRRRNKVEVVKRQDILRSYVELGIKAVEIRPVATACPTCVTAGSKRYRPRKAPPLPVAGCTRDVCRCRYVPIS